MTYLLDANVLSETRKGVGADANLARWLASVPVEETAISAMTLFELEYGVRRMEHRDPAQGLRLRLWMREIVMPEYGRRALPVDAAIMLRCADLHVPNRRPFADSIIAATALAHGLIVVTRNVRDFQPLGAEIHNPWTDGVH